MKIMLFVIAILSYVILKKYDNISKLKTLLRSKDTQIIDVRSPQEYKSGHVKHAINIPYDTINSNLLAYFNKNLPTLVYCKSGRRAEIAAKKFRKLGFTHINFTSKSYEELNKLMN